MPSLRRSRRLKGASLVVALILCVVAISFCTGMILLGQLTDQVALRSLADRKARDDAWSGIRMLLDPRVDLPEDVPEVVDLFGDGLDTVSLLQYRWGLFRVGVSVVERTHGGCERCCLMGQDYPADAPALSLRDMGRPLAISGRTVLRGPCELPKTGIRKVQVEGRTFQGDTLVHGPVRISSSSPWALDSATAVLLDGLLAGVVPPTAEEMRLDGPVPDSALQRAFSAPLLWVETTDGTQLHGQRVSGRVVLFSRDTLHIPGDCIIEDAMVCAPAIVLEQGARVRGQFFAARRIVVEEGVICAYPTVLCVRIDAKDESRIDIGAGSLVQGDIVQWMHTELQAPRSTILVAEGATVVGSIHTPALVEVRGTVNGSVSCGGTIFHTGSGIYENHLVDATMDITARDPDQASAVLDPEERGRAIISWLWP